jgi:hypothetical protein
MFGSCESDIRLSGPTTLTTASNHNVVLGTTSQFLMSPVYPKYYAGGKKCRWSLRAEPGQRIQLRFLDISLREGLSSRDPECSDSVRVSERGKTLLHMCGESVDDIVLLSQRSKLEVRRFLIHLNCFYWCFWSFSLRVDFLSHEYWSLFRN